jgi:uncharacterized protein YndB with AHSA1/START domain
MTVLTVSRVVSQPIARVWDALSDFGGIADFHPAVERSPLKEGSPERGVGATRTCHFYDGNSVEETVLESINEKVLVVEITKGSMPLARAVATIELASTADDRTQVDFTMDYTPKWGPVGALMDAMMMRKQFTALLTRVLGALDVHLDTGEAIGPDFALAAAA